MKNFILWIWCFPQMLVGFIVKHITKAECKGDYYEFSIKCGSVSLGEYIFLCPAHYGDKTVLKHENGHKVQSRILGWLYLPVVGLPSLIWAGCFDWYRVRHKISYYSFYTEKWADKLAGITRNETNDHF